MSVRAGSRECQACNELQEMRKRLDLLERRLCEIESPVPADLVFHTKMLCDGGLDAAKQKIKMQNKARMR